MKKAILICLFALLGMAQGIWAQTSVYDEDGLNSAIIDGAYIVLSDNITLSNRLVIDAELTLTIDLNGHELSRGNPSTADGYGHVMVIGGGANVTIKDSQTGGTIIGGNADAGGAIWIGPRGTVTLQSGTIQGCQSTGNGGAIYNKGTLTINGGSISGNTAADGGGIYNEEGATLTFAGGSIVNNSSTVHGGAGISNHGTLTVSGGNISGNKSVGNGSGIWTGGENSTLYMEGNPVITGNHKGRSIHNLYVSQGKVINVTGAFTSGAEIGLTLDGSQTLTSGYGTHNGDTDPNTIFILDGNLGTISLDRGEIIFVSTEYISQVMIAVGKGNKNKLVNEGWTAIEKDLNAGAGGDYVYLLYKTNINKAYAISDFYLKTGSSPSALERNGQTYYAVDGEGGTNLNNGTDGDKIYLYCTWGLFDDGRAVTGISFNGTASGAVTRDDTGAACDLNRGAGGKYIYMHVTYPQVDNFPYVERKWDATNKKVVEETKTKNISELTRLDGSNNELTNGWYVVDNNVTYNTIIEIKGNDVNLIVADGMKLYASEGIRIAKDCKLKIFGQRVGSGLVYAHANAGPGIGGRGDILAGHLEIHGVTIDAQSGSNKNAGIGSGNGQNAGFQSITIYGGYVKAKGGSEAAGIGSGKENARNNIGPIYIYGGTVYAYGGAKGAGIGSGGNESTYGDGGNGSIYINGGNVYATGGENGPGIGCGYDGHIFGTISIYGAYVIATGSKNADGIGGAGSQLSINNYVFIENSTVKAIGKSNKSGIKCRTLSIKNSVVEAKSDKTNYRFIKVQSIGYSEYNFPFMTYLKDNCMGNGLMLLFGYSEPDTKLNNSEPYPTYGAERARYVKIMPCDHQDATYTDNNDGTHTVHCNYCKNAKEAHTYEFNGLGYYCSKCDAERPGNSYFSVGKMTYNGANYQGVAYKVFLSEGAEYALPDCDNLDGYVFAGWAVVDNTSEVGDNPLASDDEKLYPAGYKLPLTRNIILVARYHSTNLFLSDDESNESYLVKNMNNSCNVTLKGRTLWKDDTWNTLCLPFSLTAEELAASQLGGYTGLKELDVEGYYDEDGNHYIYYEKVDEEDAMETGYYDDTATLYEGDASSLRQTGFDNTTGTLHLYFQDATSIEAGKPYIIKWATESPNNFETVEGDLQSPMFNGVTISSIAPASIISSDGIVAFTGTYAPVEISKEGENTMLFLGDNNTLYWPNAEMAIGCQRAYFQTTFNLGDVNGDGFVNVTDVTMLVNHILGNTNDNFITENADISGDGEITVTDVTALVNLILESKSFTNVVINGADGLNFGSGGTGQARLKNN